jgi:hypothetical protein
MDQPQESHCKYNDATQRCAFNPDPSAVQDDPNCYKTDKNRCAVKKKKMIKIKPKMSMSIKPNESVETIGSTKSHCKYNDATQRCAFNPDPSAVQDDPFCYKTDKNRCAVKKKKMIKIKPKQPSKILNEPMENVVPVPMVSSETVGIDFLYPDLNDKNFNLKISEKKEFYDTRNTEEVLRNQEFIQRADKLCNVPYELQSHQYFVKNFMSFQTPYNSLILFHGLGSGKTCSAIGVSESMRDYLIQVGIKQEILLVSNANVKNNFKKELFDISKLHRNESGIWTINGCTGNKLLKEINLDLFNHQDDDEYTPESDEKMKLKIKKQIDKIIKKSYSFMGYQKFSSIIRLLLDGDKSNIRKQKHQKKRKRGDEEEGLEEEEEEEEEEDVEDVEAEEDVEEEEDVEAELEEGLEEELEEGLEEDVEAELEEDVEAELEEDVEAEIEEVLEQDVEAEEDVEDGDEVKIKITINGIKRLKKYFNNRLIIIDEVHNLKSNNKDAAYLLALVKYADNMRLLFLSATPMFNDAKEIIWLLNLMRVNDRRPKIYAKDIFDSDNNLLIMSGKEIGKQRLQESSIGYISFVKGENPYTFPYRVFPSMFSKEHALKRRIQEGEGADTGIISYPKFTFDGKSTVPGLEYIDVYITKLKKHQNEVYIKKIEELKSGKATASSSAEKYEEQQEEMRKRRDKLGEADANEAEMLDNDNTALSGYSINNLISLRQILNMTYPYKSDFEDDIEYTYGESGLATVMDKNKGQYKYKNPKERIFSPEKIGEYSSKIKSICDSIVLKYNKAKPSESTFCDGIVLIYTYFIEGGAIPMVLALEEMGFARYKSGGTSKSLFVSGTVQKSNGLHYSLITGNQSISPNNDAEINALRSDKNVDGSVCKVVIISKSASEGVDLKNIRQIHVMDPWYNMSAIEQTIGRGIRTCSHKKLPFDKRNVQIFLHASILAGAGFETADLAMYRFSEIKAVKIGTISRALKESSVDCILNMKQNEFTVENIDTEVDLQLSTGGSVRYQIGDKPYTSACDYMKNCNYVCNPDKQKHDVNSGQNVKLGTFNESFILMNVENIIKVIKQAFREKHYYKKKDLIQFINRVKAYSLLQIHFALTQMIHDKSEFLIDIYGKYGYLLNIGDYYFFQPAELNDPSISIFEKSTPIPFKRDKITLSLKTADVNKGQLTTAAPEVEGGIEKENTTELQIENIIMSIGYTHALSINTSLSKKERNDIADAQDPAIMPGSIPMTSRDRKWYIYCYEMFEVMKGVLSAEELSWYIFVHIMDHLTFEEINALVLRLHALNQIATKMKTSVERGQLVASSKVKNGAIKIKIQKIRESVYEKSLEYVTNIIKYFQAFVTKDKDNVLYLFVDNRENARDISKKIQMYYKNGEKALTPWIPFQQEELTSTEYNELKSAFQKGNFADFVGFMQSIKDGDIVFKIKEGGNRGSVCATSPTMKRTLQDILQFKLTNVNVPSNITQITYCIIQEIVLRHYSSVRLNDKIWILNAVEAIYSI